MRYRVDELASWTGTSVDTIRYYQARGLLPRPRREGRHAWYGDEHVAALERIRELKDRGFTLAMVARVLAGELDASEQALARALTGHLAGDGAEADVDDRLDFEQLAIRTGVSPTLLEALEREGLLVPRSDDDRPYTAEDVGAVRAGLALLEAGVPLSELLALAREHDDAVRHVAERAVDLFARYVRDPIRGQAGDSDVAVTAMVGALEAMLPAASAIVTHHFRRRLLTAARSRIEADGDAAAAAVPAGATRGASR